MSATYTYKPHFRQAAHRHAKKGYEPASLAKLMQQAAQELKSLAGEVRLVEREIEEFNQFYYAEIGALYEKYKQLKRDSGKLEESEEFPVVDVSPAAEKTNAVVASLSKKIFRRVAKICHPDSGEPVGQSEFFVKLHDAYKAQDLGSLLLLEQHLHKQMQAEKNIRFIEEQLELMEQAKQALDQRKYDLMRSPAYKLRQKIFWAKMGGQDLMAQIKRHLERQILAVQLAA